MLKKHSQAFGFLTLICDLAVTAISFSAASPSGNLRLLLIILPMWALLFKGMRLYESQRFGTLKKEIFNVVKAVGIGTLFLSAFSFIFNLSYPNRGLVVAFFIINASLLALWRASIRVFLRSVREKGYNYRNFLIIGTGSEAEKVLQLVNELKHLGIRVSGLIAPNPENDGGNSRKIQGYTILGTVDELPDILYRECVDGAIIALPINHFKILKKSLEICEEMGIVAYIASDFLKRKVAKTYLEELCGMPFLSFATTPQFPGLMAIKRSLDIIISGALLILLSPLFLTIGLLIKLTSKGPALFRQSRVGLYGRRFTLLKFRTMVHNAEQLKAGLDARNAMDGPAFKIKNDPRITAMGGALRKLSIDELPQLINVLKGEMSLVGPRPPLPEEVTKYARWQIRRLSMPPGITCTWQVNGRNHIRFEDWMKLDLQYIDNWSLFLDFKILLKTVFAVAACRGAY
jgi:exopolysaccharide biosynthesis polyprenyl glycosylphosphotransferase